VGHFKGENLVGKKFNKLTVVAWSGETYWFCICDCGSFAKARKRGLTSGHRYSCGCATRCGDGNRKSTEDFVKEASDKGLDKFFDYSKVDYVTCKDKIVIKCLTHNLEFLQSPQEHLKGSGCVECRSTKSSEIQRKPVDQFVRESLLVHGDVHYSYDGVIYTSNKKKVNIHCNICEKTFRQTPDSHLSGHGCPTCAEHGFDPNKKSFLYILHSPYMTKLGITNRSASKRLQTVSRTSGEDFSIFAEYEVEGKLCEKMEAVLLKYLRSVYQNPATKFDGYTETFVGLDPHDVSEMIECLL
jgi:hypothetical protein